MSLVVIYFGTDRQYRSHSLAHHNILLGPRYGPLLAVTIPNDCRWASLLCPPPWCTRRS